MKAILPEARYADLPGVRLLYRDNGCTGPAVVFIHANTGTSASWEPQFTHLTGAGIRAIAFDRRGRGGSIPVPETGPQPASVGDDLAALVDWLGIAPFVLVGHAGGGFHAIDYATWKPDQLRGLVIVASNGSFIDSEFQVYYERLRARFIDDTQKHFLEVGPTYRMKNPTGTLRWMEIERDARSQGAPLQPLRAPNRLENLSLVKCPAMVISGGADLLAPTELMALWARNIQQAELHEVPSSGHALPWEQPERFNALLDQFLTTHSCVVNQACLDPQCSSKPEQHDWREISGK